MFILPLNRIGENFGQTVFFDYLPISEGFLPSHYEISWGSSRTFFQIGWLFLQEALIKSHRGRCGKNWPRARRLGASIPAVGCKRQANTAPGLLSPQPKGLKPFVDFCLAVSRRARPSDCLNGTLLPQSSAVPSGSLLWRASPRLLPEAWFAGYDAAPAARRCGVARSGETAASIAQHSRLQKSANDLQRPSWDFFSAFHGRPRLPRKLSPNESPHPKEAARD